MSHEPTKKPWTVMLYMAASLDEQTEAAAIRDLEELEKIGTTDRLNVVVQIDRKWPGYSERYCLRKSGSEPHGSFPVAENLKKFLHEGNPAELGAMFTEYGDVLLRVLGARNADELSSWLRQRNPDILRKAFSTGNPIVLREFVRWARTTFSADHYLLVLWGHAYGLGFGRDHGDALSMPELEWALDRRGLNIADGRKAVDVLGANACAMSYAEAAYQLKDSADFMVAPEIAMPFAGWPYEAILNEIDHNPGITPPQLGKKIVELFRASFNNAFVPRSTALTVLNLDKADELQAGLQPLVAALKPLIRRNGVRDEIANAFLDTAYGDVRPLIDLVDLCRRLKGISEVASHAEKLDKLLSSKNGLIVKHDASDLEGLQGLGIFAPSVTGAADLTRLELSKKKYEELRLARDTGWADLVYDDLEDALEPVNDAVADFVNGTGAISREDRTGVAQLLLSVHRSFERLESTLTDSEKNLIGVLKENAGTRALDARSKRSHRKVRAATENIERFGPPYLRLANGSAQDTRNLSTPEDDRLVKAVAPLANIEDALARVERTAKKVLTHSRLGLGAGTTKPDLGAGGTKPDLGAGTTKPDLGAGGTKPDLGAGGTKPDLGLLSGSLMRGFENGTSMVSTVAGLFGHVAWSLQLLEEAVGKLEGVVQVVLTSPTNGSNGSGASSDYQRRLEEQLAGAFRELADAAINAKQTLGAVIRHPSHGLGPQDGLGGAERQQLAMFGGLSPRNLQLL